MNKCLLLAPFPFPHFHTCAMCHQISDTCTVSEIHTFYVHMYTYTCTEVRSMHGLLILDLYLTCTQLLSRFYVLRFAFHVQHTHTCKCACMHHASAPSCRLLTDSGVTMTTEIHFYNHTGLTSSQALPCWPSHHASCLAPSPAALHTAVHPDQDLPPSSLPSTASSYSRLGT